MLPPKKAAEITSTQLIAAFKEHRSGYEVAKALGLSYQSLRTVIANFKKAGVDVRAKANVPARVGAPIVHGNTVGWREKGRQGYVAPSEFAADDKPKKKKQPAPKKRDGSASTKRKGAPTAKRKAKPTRKATKKKS